MDKKETGADKGGMKDYWEFTSEVFDHLEYYLEERRREVTEGLDDVATNDPYLMGFQNGFKAGFKVAEDLVMIASSKASVGQYMLDEKFMREALSCKSETC